MASKHVKEKLNSSQIKSAEPQEKTYCLSDGGNLFLEVTTTGKKSWRYNYRLNKKAKTYRIGKYPAVSLSNARDKRRWAISQIEEGKDPALIKKLEKNTIEAETFRALADRWIQVNKVNWSNAHLQRTASYLKRDAYPVIGDMAMKAIKTTHVIMIVQSVADRGAVDSAKRLKSTIAQVFDYGVVHQLCDVNPARQFQTKALNLPDTLTKGFAAIKEPIVFGGLMRSIQSYHGGVSVRFALMLAPYVALRPSELTGAEWSEIDFDLKQWVLPAKRRKLKTVRKKANRADDALVIPLSKQAIAILEEVREYTGRGRLLFPSARGNDRPLSENALRVALRTLGYTNDDHTAHGFRKSFSTMMNELEPTSKTMIDAVLGHKVNDDVEGAYNHAQYVNEKRRILQKWANYIDSLKNGADVLEFKQA